MQHHIDIEGAGKFVYTAQGISSAGQGIAPGEKHLDPTCRLEHAWVGDKLVHVFAAQGDAPGFRRDLPYRADPGFAFAAGVFFQHLVDNFIQRVVHKLLPLTLLMDRFVPNRLPVPGIN
ncbi:hypothetical protein D3C79_761850 [compost metagenome]